MAKGVKIRGFFLIGVYITTLVWTASAIAQSDFYKGKTITVYIGTTPGALYDQWSRLLAQYMPKHIPGKPDMISQNMPGAGHKIAANYVYPAMQTKTTSRFAELLKRPELLVMSGGFSPLHARISEVLGYEAFFMSGSQVAAYVYGYPDVGLLGLSEMVESVRRIVNVTDIPVFADADTGYGNAVNVHYTVKEYIRAGAAGLHIEDQESPKKSGTLAGRRLISVEEAIGKYKAAVATKKQLDADFVICARCDSIGSEGGNFE